MGIPDVGFRVAYLEATPAHVVRITKPFYLGIHAVTQDEYRQVMGNNPSWHSAAGDGARQLHDKDTNRYPVENVSWYDTVQFCRRLSELPQEKKAGRQYRLPTEAEWEYVCRAGSTAQGNGKMAHSVGPVDQDAPNAFGVSGMYCSVCEWCSDGYSRYYYARSPRNDPQGSSSVYLRVARGSEWICSRGRPLPSLRMGISSICSKQIRWLPHCVRRRIAVIVGVGNTRARAIYIAF